MSDKAKSFKPVTRPTPAEVMQTVRDTGALDNSLPTVTPAQAAREGQGNALAPQPSPTPAAAQIAAQRAPEAAPEPVPVQPVAAPPSPPKAPAAAPANNSTGSEQVQLNLRISKELDRILREEGKKYGSKKLALCLALQRGGLNVPAIDLENRSSRRDD